MKRTIVDVASPIKVAVTDKLKPRVWERCELVFSKSVRDAWLQSLATSSSPLYTTQAPALEPGEHRSSPSRYSSTEITLLFSMPRPHGVRLDTTLRQSITRYTTRMVTSPNQECRLSWLADVSRDFSHG